MVSPTTARTRSAIGTSDRKKLVQGSPGATVKKAELSMKKSYKPAKMAPTEPEYRLLRKDILRTGDSAPSWLGYVPAC